MRILIDESLPRALKKVLTEHRAVTVQEMGWSGTKNGELLKKADKNFEVLLTADQNMRFQQKLTEKQISIIVFPSNRLEQVMVLEERLKIVLVGITPGTLIEL